MWISAINPKTGKDVHCYTDPSGTPPCAFAGLGLSRDIRNSKKYKEAWEEWDTERHRFSKANLQLIKEWKEKGYIRINAGSYLGYEDFEPIEKEKAREELKLLLKHNKKDESNRYSEKDKNLVNVLDELIIEWKWDTGKMPSEGNMNELREWLYEKTHPKLHIKVERKK